MRIFVNPCKHAQARFLFQKVSTLDLWLELDGEKIPHKIVPLLCEVEAESVALLCCESLGLEGAEYARGYIRIGSAEGTVLTRKRYLKRAPKSSAPDASKSLP